EPTREVPPVPAPFPPRVGGPTDSVDRRVRLSPTQPAPIDRKRHPVRPGESLFRGRSRVPPAADLAVVRERDQARVLTPARRPASGLRRERRLGARHPKRL